MQQSVNKNGKQSNNDMKKADISLQVERMTRGRSKAIMSVKKYTKETETNL